MSLLHCLSLPLQVNFEFPLWVEVNFVSWHQNSEYHSHWVFAASPQIPDKTYFLCLWLWMCMCISLSLSLSCDVKLLMSVSCICFLKDHSLSWSDLELWERCLIIKHIIVYYYYYMRLWLSEWGWSIVSFCSGFVIFGPKQLEKSITPTSLMWNVNVTFYYDNTLQTYFPFSVFVFPEDPPLHDNSSTSFSSSFHWLSWRFLASTLYCA